MYVVNYLIIVVFVLIALVPCNASDNGKQIVKKLYASQSNEQRNHNDRGVIKGFKSGSDYVGKQAQNSISDGLKGSTLSGKAAQQHFGFTHAFAATLSFIVISELGDKTFFIAAIMAMRHSRLTVFTGALAALGAMTVLSAILGYATTVIPRWLTYYVSAALFAIFGLKMLHEASQMSAEAGLEEYEETQTELRKREELSQASGGGLDAETGVVGSGARQESGLMRIGRAFCSKTLMEAFVLTFLAEWGDRSQITTIILAAREDVFGVIIGGTLGHGLCTGLAVIGGRFVAQRISVRTVTLIGGVLFILFALSALVIGPESNS